MLTFPSAREAKEYLAARVEQEAQRQGITLTSVERSMLLFSETDWAPADADEVSDAFDREYDQGDYERKLSPILAAARQRGLNEGDDWQEAVDRISSEDHYLLALLAVAQGSLPVAEPRGAMAREVAKRLSIGFMLAIVAAGLVLGTVFLFQHRG